MWNGLNKRKFPRHSINVELNVAFDSKVKYVEATTENIGVGGLCFMSDKRIDPFQEVTLKLKLADGAMPIECNGRVSWIVEKHTVQPSNNEFDIGIEFVNINSNDRSRIEKMISEKERV